MTFADAARRAAGVATGILGWRVDDFWSATPAELIAALAVHAPPDPGIGELKRMIENDGR